MSKPTRSEGLLDGLSNRLANNKRDAQSANLVTPQSAKRQQLQTSMSLSQSMRDLANSETQLSATKAQLREAQARIESLERDRRWFSDREQEEIKGRERERKESAEEMARLNETVSSLRIGMATFQQEYADMQDELAEVKRTTSRTIQEQQLQLEEAKRPRLSTVLRDDDDNATRTMEFTMPSFSASTSTVVPDSKPSFSFTDSETKLLEQQLSKTTEYLRKMESKNSQLEAELVLLRERKERIGVLEEEKQSLADRLAKMEKFRDQAIKLQTALDAERAKSKASSSASVSSPHQSKLAAELTSLRKQYLSSLDINGQLKADIAALQQQNSHLESQLEATLASQEQATERIRELEDEALETSQSWEREKREVEYLKGAVASYQAEAQISSSSSDDSEAVRLRTYIQQLEQSLAEHKQELHRLQKRAAQGPRPSLSASTSSSFRPGSLEKELQRLQNERDEFEKENASLLAKIDHLEQRLHDLGGELAIGSHIPPSTRVLQLKDNPAQQWFDTREELVKGLKKEGEALRAKVQELEELVNRQGTGDAAVKSEGSSSARGGTIPLESWEMVTREKATLEEEIKAKDKRMLRLKQIFTSKGEEFKQAVASILGVKLAFHTSGQIRVTSIYDLNASFVFSPSKGGEGGATMELVATNEQVGEEIPELMRNWIGERQCPPCFMASVTLDSWERSLGR